MDKDHTTYCESYPGEIPESCMNHEIQENELLVSKSETGKVTIVKCINKGDD